MSVVLLRLNDRIFLKKPHPCGGNSFRILRVGGEMRIVCETCGRDMTVDRIKLEKAIRKVEPALTEQSETKTQKGNDRNNG